MSLIHRFSVFLVTMFFFFSFITTCSLASSASRQETLIGVVGADFVMLGADSSVSQSIALQHSQVDKIHILRGDAPPFVAAAAAGDLADVDRLMDSLKAHAVIREYESSMGSDVEYTCLGNTEKDDFITHASSDDNEGGLTVEAVAWLARAQIASSLRSPIPFQTSLLVAGMQQVQEEDHDYVQVPFFSRLQQQVQRASREFQQEHATNSAVDVNKDKDGQHDGIPVPSSSLHPRLYWLDSYGALQKVKYGAHGLGANFLWSILDRGYRPNMTKKEALHLIQECFRQLKIRYVINSPQPPCIKCIDACGCHVMNATQQET